jgi:hypothetical protein
MKSNRSLNRCFCLVICHAALVLAPLLSGCTSAKVNNAPTASVGQQLMDLDKSYKDGIITQKEYERLKREIIKKND